MSEIDGSDFDTIDDDGSVYEIVKVYRRRRRSPGSAEPPSEHSERRAAPPPPPYPPYPPMPPYPPYVIVTPGCAQGQGCGRSAGTGSVPASQPLDQWLAANVIPGAAPAPGVVQPSHAVASPPPPPGAAPGATPGSLLDVAQGALQLAGVLGGALP